MPGLGFVEFLDYCGVRLQCVESRDCSLRKIISSVVKLAEADLHVLRNRETSRLNATTTIAAVSSRSDRKCESPSSDAVQEGVSRLRDESLLVEGQLIRSSSAELGVPVNCVT